MLSPISARVPTTCSNGILSKAAEGPQFCNAAANCSTLAPDEFAAVASTLAT